MFSHYVRLASMLALVAGVLSAQSRAPRVAQPTPPPVRLHTFTSPEHDFALDFPAAPERHPDVETLGDPVRHYVSQAGTTLYQLVCARTGLAPDSRAGNRLPPEFARETEAQAQREGGTVIAARTLGDGLYEYERWTPMDGDPRRKLHFIVRHVRRSGRHYVLSCSSLIPGVMVNPEACGRFFNSFRVLTGTAPSAGSVDQ